MVHDGTRVEVPTARQREVPRQLRKLVSGIREWYEWSTAVHERCTDYAVVHEIAEWYTSTSGARDGCTRVHSGARVVHEITEWCTSITRV